MTITASPAWAAIDAHRKTFGKTRLRDLFASDAQRVDSLSLSFDDIYYDFSKQRLTRETLGLLVALAKESLLADRTQRMFDGERINASEDRSVLHVALRRSAGPFPNSQFDVMPEVIETKQRMAEFAERLRAGKCLGHKGAPIRNVVNIGIGGSDLGPKMMAYALRSVSHPTLAVHYVSNLDGAQLAPSAADARSAYDALHRRQ